MATKPAPQKTHTPVIPKTSFVLPSGMMGEMIYDPVKHTTGWGTYRGGSYDQPPQVRAGRARYEPYSPHNPLLVHRVVRFPTTNAHHGSTQKLLQTIRTFIHQYMELPPVAEHLAVYYVLLSWIYDSFNEVPYLRIRGDYGTGKTRFLAVVGALCYKPIMASGASTVAPLFHILDQLGGTLVLDEADYRYSGETADITKILNNGHARGFPVLRCERQNKGKEFMPMAYHVFGPKIIASRKRYRDQALESRCITLETSFVRSRMDIPTTLPPSFEQEALAIRNQLLSWRFEHFTHARDVHHYADQTISARLNQIYTPLLSLIEDETIKAQVSAFITTQEKKLREDLGLTVEANVLSVIKKRHDNKKRLSVGEIAEDFKTRYRDEYERTITPNWIGGVIRRRLDLATRKSNGIYIIAEGQGARLQLLYERYNLITEEKRS